MSVIIKGMEMPKSCWECEAGRASQLDNNTCPFYAMEGQEQENYQNKIAEGCPISYVPPHGRLIDADALIEDLERQCKEVFLIDAVSPDDYWITRNEAYNEALWKSWVESFGDYLKTRPTVIEAEEET